VQILEGRLYIASAVQASNWELLSELNVTHIVNCSRTCNFDGTGTNPFSSMINYCSCGFADNASVSLPRFFEPVRRGSAKVSGAGALVCSCALVRASRLHCHGQRFQLAATETQRALSDRQSRALRGAACRRRFSCHGSTHHDAPPLSPPGPLHPR
jgi:hypothetical protein